MNPTTRYLTILAAGAGAGITCLLTRGSRRGGVNVEDGGRANRRHDALPLALVGGVLVYCGLRRTDAVGAGAVTLGVNMLIQSHPVVRSLMKSLLVAQVMPDLRNVQVRRKTAREPGGRPQREDSRGGFEETSPSG